MTQILVKRFSPRILAVAALTLAVGVVAISRTTATAQDND